MADAGGHKELDQLLRAVLTLRHVGEARRFFRDLLTDDEIEMITRRWQVAAMLGDGYSYRQIEQATGMSSRTVARIARWYKQGPGGYRLALARRKQQAGDGTGHHRGDRRPAPQGSAGQGKGHR